MNAKRSGQSLRPTRLLPLLTLGVCLTGCSTFLEEVAKASGEPSRPAAVASVAVEPPPPPQLPEALERCLKRSMRAKQQAKPKQTAQPAPSSADALVIAEQKLKRDREACAYQIFKWHQDQRQQVAAAQK